MKTFNIPFMNMAKARSHSSQKTNSTKHKKTTKYLQHSVKLGL